MRRFRALAHAAIAGLVITEHQAHRPFVRHAPLANIWQQLVLPHLQDVAHALWGPIRALGPHHATGLFHLSSFVSLLIF